MAFKVGKKEHGGRRYWGKDMTVKPTVAFRAILVGGIAAFAKIAGVAKAAGGVKVGAAAAAVTAAATAAMSGSKHEPDSTPNQPPPK